MIFSAAQPIKAFRISLHSRERGGIAPQTAWNITEGFRIYPDIDRQRISASVWQPMHIVQCTCPVLQDEQNSKAPT